MTPLMRSPLMSSVVTTRQCPLPLPAGRSSPSPHNIPLSAYERRGSAPGSLIGTPLRRGSVDPSTAAAAASANVAAAAAAAGAAGAVTAEDDYRPFGTSAGMSRAVRRGGISGCLLAIVQFLWLCGRSLIWLATWSLTAIRHGACGIVHAHHPLLTYRCVCGKQRAS